MPQVAAGGSSLGEAVDRLHELTLVLAESCFENSIEVETDCRVVHLMFSSSVELETLASHLQACVLIHLSKTCFQVDEFLTDSILRSSACKIIFLAVRWNTSSW